MATSYRYDPWRFLKIGLVALLAIGAVSTLVYYLLGIYYGTHWPLLECVFMVVITLSTIGYGDWLQIQGKQLAEIYTMFLVIVGMGVPAFIIAMMIALIVEGVLGDTVRRRRMEQEIAKLSGHIIVCGAGGIGEHCIQELLKLGRKIVVIDRDVERLKGLQERLGAFPYLVGTADHDDMLKAAGILRAEGLIACLKDDKDNLFITLSAKLLNPELKVASKSVDDEVRKKMLIAGANAVISPTAIGGLRMVSELIRPATVSFLDSMMRERTAVRFGELAVGRSSRLLGRTLAQADLRSLADVLVVAARHPGVENFIYNPKADFLMEADCVIVVLGPVQEIDRLRPLFDGR
jgi:voltage-gated potassium channel